MRPVARRPLAAVALVAASGLLAAGCQGSAAPSTARLRARTVATVASPTPTTSVTSPEGSSPSAPKAEAARTLPGCGALRDPFDPSASPPPPGSPAIC